MSSSSSQSPEPQSSLPLSLPIGHSVYSSYPPKSVPCSMSFWSATAEPCPLSLGREMSASTERSLDIYRPSTSKGDSLDHSSAIMSSLRPSAFHATSPAHLSYGLFPVGQNHHRYPSSSLALYPSDLCPSYPAMPPVFSSGLPIMPRASFPSCPPFLKPSLSARRRYDSSRASHEDGPKNCHICGKTYARLSTLRLHLKTHSGIKPYQCMVCLKSFTQAANLTAHFRVHSGEKPFKCRICERQFSQSSSVTTHMRTHSGDRPYRCKVCSKAFADSSTLTKHVRTHTGERPYQCDICLQRFSQSGNMNRHKRIHNEV